MTPAQVTGPDPATVALISNAQSGSLNRIDDRAPAEGAGPSGFQAWVPARLLEGSNAVLQLLAYNPFPERPPRYVRALLYDYRFTGREARFHSPS